MRRCPKCNALYDDSVSLCPQDGEILEKDGDELIGRVLGGKYRIEERIGEGGMGKIYRATHVLMDKTVAVKVLSPQLAADRNVVARFTREARIASRISHPHAIAVTDFGEDAGRVFLAMEYLPGRTLKELIEEEGPLPIDRVVEIARQIASALDAAHAQGVIHRDLKSANVMLTEVEGKEDWVKVLDFGIAKITEAMDPDLTAPHLVVGTPHYMSPEQCAHASVDARSDVYSLGVIIYEMLTGHVPFMADSAAEVLHKQMHEPPPSVREERPALPLAIDRVVARALAKRPEERFQSAGELAEALALAATGVEQTAAFAEKPRSVLSVGEATKDGAGEALPKSSPPPGRIKPWHLLVPGFVLLAIVFAIFYVWHLNAEKKEPPIVNEPGLRPVRPARPATGESERDLASGLDSNINANRQATEGATTAFPVPTDIGPALSPNVEPRLIEEAKPGDRNVNGNVGISKPQTVGPGTSPESKPIASPAPQRRQSPEPSSIGKPSPTPTVSSSPSLNPPTL
ncbi:serine/threonine-protein kinase [Pyrinomonas methylaliphatogenes]|uniref:non-specific serine/threonine protein kinase n=1 Tax=Pyrinomonas methylaliphatogenes TaxID=454194 RepID=A0A0B6X384_9BACT|nr:serine/threonine-protein kinase [Pyrinomonas methylaliphatogenes]CDM66974.1 protein kinase family protein [Pyrinomonas methylaliphatogenes]